MNRSSKIPNEIRTTRPQPSKTGRSYGVCAYRQAVSPAIRQQRSYLCHIRSTLRRNHHEKSVANWVSRGSAKVLPNRPLTNTRRLLRSKFSTMWPGEETEEHRTRRVNGENPDIDEQMTDGTDQTGQVEAKYAPHDACGVLYDVQDTANDLLRRVLAPRSTMPPMTLAMPPTTAPVFVMFNQSTT